ncbi:MAG: DEAD/DEAH box helicase [Treponema sp.]|jgi:superfamily II DNA/RNA helicase|nr:DEAD/DEAH box helicase [Treponema sp.]
MTTFTDLGTDPFFIQRLSARNIYQPTEIQQRVIPRLLAGENLLFRSATGTGKTFAYLIPLFQRFLIPGDLKGNKRSAPGPVILILAPTYELCSQIKQEADFLVQDAVHTQGLGPFDAPVQVSLIIGAANMSRQIDGLKKERPAVIVGNPARLLVLARMGKLRLDRIEALVLDEGDRLTVEELAGETGELLRRVNSRRQSAACSATMSTSSRERLLPLLGGTAAFEETEEQEILRERISHWALFSEGRRKISTLGSFLVATGAKKALVFTDRGGQVGNIVSQLQYHRVPAVGLYGAMDKKHRKQAIDDFRAERARVLVSSDLAARGLDIPGISHVIALDVSRDPEVYIHRAGRTGRAGRRGIMVSIGDGEEMQDLAGLEKKLGIVVYPKVLYRGSVCVPEPQN